MKKFVLLLAIFALFTNINAYSVETNASDYEVMPISEVSTAENTDEIVIYETEKFKIIQNGKSYFSIKNTDGDYVITQDWENVKAVNDTGNLLKFTKQGKFVFFDALTGELLMYPADDFSLLGSNLKIYKNGKYGLIDNYGNTILEPVYERISITNFDDKEYLVAKQNGKNLLFYNNGELVQEEDLYTITTEESLSLLAKDIKPIIKTNYLKSISKKLVEENNVTNKFEELNIEKNELSEKTITIKNKTYYVTYDEKKIGLSTMQNKRILPASYDSISVKQLSGKFSTPVLLAEKKGVSSIYSLKGKLLAEEIDNKINIYKYGKVYTYINGEVLQNGEKVGNLILENNEYKFEKTKTMFLPISKVNELILTILQDS